MIISMFYAEEDETLVDIHLLKYTTKQFNIPEFQNNILHTNQH